MNRLLFQYFMQVSFQTPVQKHCYTLKCIPASTCRQEISELEVRILPSGRECYDVDGYGNRIVIGRNEKPHSCFEVAVKGKAEISENRHEDERFTLNHHIYQYPSKYTCPGPALREYHKRLREELLVRIPAADQTGERKQVMRQESAYKKAVRYMEHLYRDFAYEAGVTNTKTTAEEALSLGRGVCQDYAHILLALLRMDRIPARYVVGMLTGEGYSHAWIEVYSSGRWYGLDPTNKLLVGNSHVKISHGRDYEDCTISRGVFYGGSGQQQMVSVKVEER